MRQSIVTLSADDLINLNETVYDMLRLMLRGLKLSNVEWYLRFAFMRDGDSMYIGRGEFLEQVGENLRLIPGVEPWHFSFRAPDGLGTFKSLELLRSEVANLSIVMTQGLVSDQWGSLSQRMRREGGSEFSMMFFRDENLVNILDSKMKPKTMGPWDRDHAGAPDRAEHNAFKTS